MKVKSNNSQGFEEVNVNPAVIDMSYPTSTTRRGRVQDGGAVSPTITHSDMTCAVDENYDEKFRIRKLTERECFRLMGVHDEDIDKIQSANISKSQQYKMAGNSIVCDVLEAIFTRMFVETEPQKGDQLTIF